VSVTLPGPKPGRVFIKGNIMRKLFIIFIALISLSSCQFMAVNVYQSFNLPAEFNDSMWAESQPSGAPDEIYFSNEKITFKTIGISYEPLTATGYDYVLFKVIGNGKYSIISFGLSVVEITMLTNSDILVTRKGITKPYHRI
jgi:hypothetical protein